MPVAYYRLEQQSFEGLRPCTALLGFVADRFYEARLDCGHDPKVGALLHQRYGTPAQEDAQYDVWQNERVSVSLNRSVMSFAIADRALTQALHQLIIQKALSGGAAGAGVPATPAH